MGGARWPRGLWSWERRLWARGARWIAGVDEVGVGPLAGPVVAAAVVFPPGRCVRGLRDSKVLTPNRREVLSRKVWESALAVGIGRAEVEEIDALNIYRAAQLAMRRATAALPVAPEHVLVDGRRLEGLDLPQTAIAGGDARIASIAAASIVAKVHRDRIMQVAAASYPDYGFSRHVGYGTPEHMAALRRLGPCPIHRRSFGPVRALLEAS